MRTVESLQQEYTRVTPDKGFTADPVAKVQLADLHSHPHVDSHTGLRRMLRSYGRRGVDVVAITDHDEGGDKAVLDRAQRIRDEVGYDIQLIAASEMTALPVDDPHNRSGKHVLVFREKGPLQESIQPLMPWTKLHHAAEDQGAVLFVAHPELQLISYTRTEIKRMIDADLAPHGIEVHNGSGSLYDRHGRLIKAVRDLPGLPEQLRLMIPNPGSNALAREMHRDFLEDVPGLGFIGGSDAHEAARAGEVVYVTPEGVPIFDALREGEGEVWERKKLAPINPFSTAHNWYLGLQHLEKPSRDALLDGYIPPQPEDEVVIAS